jgi:acetylornithine deacetylase/succinyl-diaminopimelate desuccinylase family protein
VSGDQSLGTALADILADLIAIPSTTPPGDTQAICAYAGDRLAAAGYRVETPMRTPPIANTVATLGEGAPCVVFNAHIDTVGTGDRAAWNTDPFTATLVDGAIHGLGANNCKGSAAVHLWLAAEVARRGGPARGSIVFTMAGDEERLGPEGTSYLRDDGLIRPDILVLGAPTENHLIVEERGILWIEIETTGRAAHGGDPPAGDNAILRMIRLIERLRTVLEPRLAERREGEKISTMNIGTIHAGENPNVVPDRCVARIDRRLLPSEAVEEADAEMQAILAETGEPADRYVVRRIVGTNGFSAPRDGTGVSTLATAIEAHLGKPPEFLNALASSDGRFFANDGIEIVNFGPGDGATSHAANERVPLNQMIDAAVILRAFVERVLGFAS